MCRKIMLKLGDIIFGPLFPPTVDIKTPDDTWKYKEVVACMWEDTPDCQMGNTCRIRDTLCPILKGMQRKKWRAKESSESKDEE